MIARVWRGWVRTERLAEYVAIVDRTGLAGYRRTPGNAGAQLLTRDLGEGRTELITISWWTDLQHIKSFAGEDIELAIYYPEDDEYLLERESTVAHFEVTPPREVPDGVQPDAGTPAFTLTRVYPAAPPVVFAHFTEPAPFCRWFVVDGHTTPPDRVTLDARPGGRISGTMVAQQDGQEIPFSATYGRVEPPWTVQFGFSGPPEVVTMTLTDLGAAGTQLTYRNEGCPPEDRAEALVGVGRMLDALEASLTGAAR